VSSPHQSIGIALAKFRQHIRKNRIWHARTAGSKATQRHASVSDSFRSPWSGIDVPVAMPGLSTVDGVDPCRVPTRVLRQAAWHRAAVERDHVRDRFGWQRRPARLAAQLAVRTVQVRGQTLGV